MLEDHCESIHRIAKYLFFSSCILLMLFIYCHLLHLCYLLNNFIIKMCFVSFSSVAKFSLSFFLVKAGFVILKL